MSEATVIALGFFDGVHLGHGALLRKTAEHARELGVTPAAFTFDRSPKEFVTGVPVPLLTSAAERAEIIRAYYGIDTVFVLSGEGTEADIEKFGVHPTWVRRDIAEILQELQKTEEN